MVHLLICEAMSCEFWLSLFVDIADADAIDIRLNPNSRLILARILVENEFNSLQLLEHAEHPSTWEGADEMLPHEIDFLCALCKLRCNFKLLSC